MRVRTMSKKVFQNLIVTSSQIVAQAHDKQPLIKETFHSDPIDGKPNEIRDEGEIPDKGLDAVNQAVKLLWRKPGSGNENIIDLRFCQDRLNLVQGSQIGKIANIFLSLPSVIDIANDMIIQPDVVLDAAQGAAVPSCRPQQEGLDSAQYRPSQGFLS